MIFLSRSLPLVAAFLLAVSSLVRPAYAQTADPAAQQLLAAMWTATGGDRWKPVHDLHIVSSTEYGGMTAPTERWEDVAAGRFVTRSLWPDRSVADGFDGISTWTLGRSGVAYLLGDPDSALVSADEAFRVSRAWWFPERHAATIAFIGTRNADGRMFDVLSVTPEGGRPFQAWIDHETHLLARTDEQQAEDRVVISYGNYRDVGGLKLPFTIRTGDEVDPSYAAVETIGFVEINSPARDSIYSLPPRSPSDVSFPAGFDRVEVPFRLTADDRILVALRINNARTVEAEFDSGGSLVIQPAVLAAMKLTGKGREKETGGGEGAVSSTAGRLDVVGLGDVRIRNPGFHSFGFAPDQPDRALVGLEVLQRLVVCLDFDRQIMTLTKPEAYHVPDRGAAVPFHFQSNQPEIRGTIDGIGGLFTIDTGDAGSLLLIAPFAQRYALVKRYDADLPYSGKAVSASHGVFARKRVHTVSFDGSDGRPVEEALDPVTRISLQKSGFDANRDVSANIGLGILKRFNITFDYNRQRIILERNHLYGAKDVFNRAGLRLKREAEAWTVTAVYEGSPAGQAGVRPGDIVRLINGEGPKVLDAEKLANLLLGPLGSILTLQLSASGTTKAVKLSLRDII